MFGIGCITNLGQQAPRMLLIVKIDVFPGTSDAVLSASPPSRSLPADDLYYEVVEARLGNGLFYTRGGQRVRFGDTPQVCSGLSPMHFVRTG